jgi:uncharacterized GH25 family protein
MLTKPLPTLVLLLLQVALFQAAVLQATVFQPTAAQAHFVWIDARPGADGKLRPEVYFGETPAPGEADLLDRVAQTKAWLRSAGGTRTVVELQKSADAERPAWLGQQPLAGPSSLEADCLYGVFSRGPKPLLLHYYAKHLSNLDDANWQQLCRADALELDLVPQKTATGLTLTALWQGQPAPGAEVVVNLPGSDEPQKMTTDAQGRVALALPSQGRLSARVRLLEADRKGEHQGKTYDGALHYATLTMELAMNPTTTVRSEQPAAQTELTAPALLERARLARCTWRNVPGFRARLAVEVPGFRGAGQLTVSADGDVALEGFPAGFDAKPVQGYLESLVQHRLADTSADENVEYVAESQPHPLGRLIRFIGDEKMQSSYRVRDDMVTQVNRVMGDNRFSIDVLDIQRDAAGKYLPRVFTVSYWDKTSGSLRRTETHVNHWLAVGAFELPRSVSLVRATAEGDKVMQLELSRHELLPTNGAKP